MESLQIFFENADFVVVNKPENLNFHSENQPGLVVFVQKMFPNDTIFPVHRLDKMTSGLILFAKHKTAAQQLGELFAERKLQKFYLALAHGKPKKKQGWVKGDMLPARRGSWKLSNTLENPAITQFVSQLTVPGERLYLLKLHTGKTHQIRVAMKSLGVPILGDLRYQETAKASLADRGYLHAYAVKFDFKGQTYQFVLPPSQGAEFQKPEVQMLIQQWAQPWQYFIKE
ncbi:TIGR01621 family pseudouridine synthase [Thiosulfativibrio zosterae]|uniref:RNA pseudouridine synthase n=1 Tax=Thiosulfativibrio zosterae TaxID=2675053 RepID=A0A6F8PMQ7_9GAMM|nr:TIGR01621 family pseudouridine synthase [Thiosulfativibrio zosterae]BBP43327.1 RNA pseudouridine synthase [Thiosulfativibrio zosterae]